MKKITSYSLIFISLLVLGACSQVDKAIKGEDYVASSQAKQEQEKLLKADRSSFPQLSDKVTKDEAEVIMHTSAGDITIKLFPKYAPLASENFLTHAKENYYNGLSFHRVISDFMIQAGDPNGDGTGGESIWKGKDDSKDSGHGFVNEISPYLYNIRGALAMANAGANTNGSQFFINQNSQNQSQSLSENAYPKAIINAYKSGGNPSLDGDYTVFGQVISGMDIVDKIAKTSVDKNDKPTEPITIISIEIVKDYSFSK